MRTIGLGRGNDFGGGTANPVLKLLARAKDGAAAANEQQEREEFKQHIQTVQKETQERMKKGDAAGLLSGFEHYFQMQLFQLGMPLDQIKKRGLTLQAMREGTQPIIRKPDALKGDNSVDHHSSLNAQMYLAKNMKRIVELLSMSEEASRKAKKAQPVEVPKVQTIDKFMDYRDEIKKTKTETKMYTRLDREKEEAVEQTIEDLIQ